MKYAILCAMAVLLTACGGTGPVIGETHDYCALTDPILIGSADTLSEDTASDILEHNLLREELCG